VETLPYSQSRISKHLAVLRKADLVRAERRSSWAFYEVTPSGLEAARDFLGQIEESLRILRVADSCD
jgi:DNA-binding transcriptional ArsR family regulator